MSKIAQEDVQCPHCGNVSKCNFYASVNVTIDPTLKVKVLDGSIFKKKCPNCETGFDVRHDLLYHNMEQGLCVWLKYEDEFWGNRVRGGSGPC